MIVYIPLEVFPFTTTTSRANNWSYTVSDMVEVLYDVVVIADHVIQHQIRSRCAHLASSPETGLTSHCITAISDKLSRGNIPFPISD